MSFIPIFLFYSSQVNEHKIIQGLEIIHEIQVVMHYIAIINIVMNILREGTPCYRTDLQLPWKSLIEIGGSTLYNINANSKVKLQTSLVFLH
jgi:hypothetical protein